MGGGNLELNKKISINKRLLDSLNANVKVQKNEIGMVEARHAQYIIDVDKTSMALDNYEKKPYLTSAKNNRYFEVLPNRNLFNACIIAGSADSIFELLRRGITKIDAVDINKFQIMTAVLKVAALKTLDRNEYEDFLLYDNPRLLSYNTFKRIIDNIDDEEAKSFWDTLIRNNASNTDVYDIFFKNQYAEADKYRYNNLYIKKNGSYELVRKNLENASIKFHQSDALDFLLNSRIKYDIIDITNILLSYYQKYDFDEIDIIMKKIDRIYNEKLEPNGIFILDYWRGIIKSELPEMIDRLLIEKIDKDFTITDRQLLATGMKELGPIVYEHVRNIYKDSYDRLSKYGLVAKEITKASEGYGPKNDTIVYTRKMMK